MSSEASPVIALEARSISKRFVTRRAGSPWARSYVEALKAVSVTIAEGETFGIVGESGSGTSTLNPLLSLSDAVAFGPGARGPERQGARRAAEAALDRVGLRPAQFGRR